MKTYIMEEYQPDKLTTHSTENSMNTVSNENNSLSSGMRSPSDSPGETYTVEDSKDDKLPLEPEDQSAEFSAALDLSVGHDKSYLEMDSTFDNSIDEEEDSLDVAPEDIPPLNSDALFEIPFKDELAANSDSIFQATPPIPSPRKSSHIKIPMPRVPSGSLKIMKRRKLDSSDSSTSPTTRESTPLPLHHQRITPSKSRSFSGPLIDSFQKRAPSLQDKPIPVLSPPSPLNPVKSPKSISLRSVSSPFISPTSFKTPVLRRRNSSELMSVPDSTSSSSSSGSSSYLSHSVSPSRRNITTPLNRGKENLGFDLKESPILSINEKPRSSSYQLAPPSTSEPPLVNKSPTKKSPVAPLSVVTPNLGPITSRSPSATLHAPNSPNYIRTSPLTSRHKDPKIAELSTKNSLLDQEIKKLKELIETAKQAKKYQSSGEREKLLELEKQWRDVAQKGASYLYNEAACKVERMGGMQEFVRRKKEDEEARQQMNDYEEDSIDLDKFSKEEREEYLAMKEEYDEEVRIHKQELKTSTEEEDEPNKFTMKYMLKTLNVDYRMIYPDGYDTDED